MAYNQDVIISKLMEQGIIVRQPVRGQYKVLGEAEAIVRRNDILARFAVEVEQDRYTFNWIAIDDVRRAYNRANRPAPAPEPEPLRTIRRDSYHSNGGGADRDGIQEALERIQADEDGVVRSFGIEYEVYRLNGQQEDKLARLLDTLPAHVCERDGSLSSSGVEIVFMPMGAEEFVRTVKTLAQFVRDNNVTMEENRDVMAGMHITYGVSNPEASKSDLQIRLNRFALAVQAVGTRQKIEALFGRTFGHYRSLPTSTFCQDHSNAFSCNGRPRTCWECRLPNWKCNPEGMVNFFRATEVAFHRPIVAADFMKVFDILGGDDGE